MFDSIFTTTPITVAEFFLMALVAILAGLLFSWIISFKIRANKRFFFVTSLLPFIVGSVIAFVNGNIGAGIAIGGAFALIRFRSAQGTSDEIVTIFITLAAGVAFGMGYLAYGVIILLGCAVIFFLLTLLPIFEHKGISEEKLLKITIPESLEYNGAFDEIFSHYLKSVTSIGVKTTGMGSMFRLSYRIKFKNPQEEKEFIDEIRIRNGNLEVSILPYTEVVKEL